MYFVRARLHIIGDPDVIDEINSVWSVVACTLLEHASTTLCSTENISLVQGSSSAPESLPSLVRESICIIPY